MGDELEELLSPCSPGGRRLYDFEPHRSHAFLYGGHDPGVCAHLNGAWFEWLLGYPDKALTSVDYGVRLGERLADPLGLHQAFFYGAVLHLFWREPEMVLPYVRGGEVIATEQRVALYMEPEILRSGAILDQAAVWQAAASLGESLAERQAIGRRLHGPYQLALLSEGLARAGDRDGAVAALAEAGAMRSNIASRTKMSTTSPRRRSAGVAGKVSQGSEPPRSGGRA